MTDRRAGALVDRIGPHVVRAAIRYVPPRRRGIRLADAWERVTSHRPSLVLSREPSGMRLRCDLRDKLSRVIFYRGWVDRDVETWLGRWLRPGDTYVDVGAHIGFYVSLALAAIGPSGRVIAFEPLDESYEKLSASVREVSDRYPKVDIHRAAVGAIRGEATFFRPAGDWAHQTYVASLVAAENLTSSGRVRVVTLDDALGTTRCRLLKIDVEGSEREVLHGANTVLSRRQAEAVLIELNPAALHDAGTTMDEVVTLLSRFGYRPHEIEGAALAPVAELGVPDDFANVVFLPADE